MFKRILIANRGEIAVRIAQTVQEMGLAAIAAHSEPDRSSVHVLRADEAYPLEGKTAAETYLRGDRIIDIARRHGVDAIHPGYGFLSENASFAEACGKAEIAFIGPTPQVIRATGDKVNAKKTLAAAVVNAAAIVDAADTVGRILGRPLCSAQWRRTRGAQTKGRRD